MFKKIAFLLLVLNGYLVLSQDFSAVDGKVKNYPDFSSIDELSIRIQNDFEEDRSRVRAAFIWLTENIRYGRTLDELFAPTPKIIHNSEYGKKYQIEKYRLKQISSAFLKKEGVCIDYSLMLSYLFEKFGLASKVIYGLGKTDIKDSTGKQLVKNHSWNAVLIDGSWKLIDPTWASGYFDLASRKFIKKLFDHYFFTAPADFAKSHFPGDSRWQLLDSPIKLSAFFSAPIFFPAYFDSRVKLSQNMPGTLVLSNENESLLIFDELSKRKKIFYQISGETRFRKMKFRKRNNKIISKIKFRKNLKSDKFITVFNEEKAIINFKIKGEN